MSTPTTAAPRPRIEPRVESAHAESTSEQRSYKESWHDAGADAVSPSSSYPNLLFAVGASAGGLAPLQKLFAALPKDLQATVVVATHRTPTEENGLLDVLEKSSNVRVCEPVDGEKLRCTAVYVGRGCDRVLTAGRELEVGHLVNEISRFSRIDDLFYSVAMSAGPRAVGIILSGTLWDGVRGLQAIHRVGGRCIVQEPSEAAFREMPMNALQNAHVDLCATIDEIAKAVTELAQQQPCVSPMANSQTSDCESLSCGERDSD